MNRQWEWVLIDKDGVTRYPGVGPQAAYAAVGVDVDSDDLAGDRPHILEFRWL
jgi:hypothetical protein